jgi:hypothetical protein
MTSLKGRGLLKNQRVHKFLGRKAKHPTIHLPGRPTDATIFVDKVWPSRKLANLLNCG